MVTVRRATAAEGVIQVPQGLAQPPGLFGGEWSDRSITRDMFSSLVHRDVQIFGSRAVEPQSDVLRHAPNLLVVLRADSPRSNVLIAADNVRPHLGVAEVGSVLRSLRR